MIWVWVAMTYKLVAVFREKFSMKKEKLNLGILAVGPTVAYPMAISTPEACLPQSKPNG